MRRRLIPLVAAAAGLAGGGGLLAGPATAATAPCPGGTIQYALANLSDSAQPTGTVPLVFAGSRMRVTTRCKYGEGSVRYPLRICVTRPGGVRCVRTAAVGDRFSAAVVIPTVPNRRFLYRIAWSRRPGGAAFQRIAFRTYAGE